MVVVMLFIDHYYHIYCGVDGWQEIVADHFQALGISGLLSHCMIGVGIVGPEDQRKAVKQMLKSYSVIVVAEADYGWEQVTLKSIWQNVKRTEHEYLIFYAHTKGVANKSKVNDEWRRAMTRRCVDDWRQCVRLLELSDDFDVVGSGRIVYNGSVADFTGSRRAHVMLADLLNSEADPDSDFHIEPEIAWPGPGQAIFAGNFWWCRASWIRTLNEPATVSRYDAETWVASKNKDGEWPRAKDSRPGWPVWRG
jgi:hypothetical protein